LFLFGDVRVKKLNFKKDETVRNGYSNRVNNDGIFCYLSYD
jgi:hypothetical protein